MSARRGVVGVAALALLTIGRDRLTLVASISSRAMGEEASMRHMVERGSMT